MRKRNVDKHIWFDRQEAQDLQKKAKKACLTEAALIRKFQAAIEREFLRPEKSGLKWQ